MDGYSEDDFPKMITMSLKRVDTSKKAKAKRLGLVLPEKHQLTEKWLFENADRVAWWFLDIGEIINFKMSFFEMFEHKIGTNRIFKYGCNKNIKEFVQMSLKYVVGTHSLNEGLLKACGNNNLEIVKMIIDKGGDHTYEEFAPLDWAINSEAKETAKYLLELSTEGIFVDNCYVLRLLVHKKRKELFELVLDKVGLEEFLFRTKGIGLKYIESLRQQAKIYFENKNESERKIK